MTRNVLLIVLDTARKDYFDRHAERLRSRSDSTFAQCRTVSSCSVPSHASILTGELPHQHGQHSTNVDYTSIPYSNTFLSQLPEHTTIGVSANTFAGSNFGFSSHFDRFVDVSWTSRLPDGMDVRTFKNETDAEGIGFYAKFLRECLGHDAPFKSLSNGILAQLDLLTAKSPLPKLLDDGGKSVLKRADAVAKEEPEPFFMFLNLMDIHTPHHHVRGYNRSTHGVPSSWTSIDAIDHWSYNLDPAGVDEQDLRNFRSLYAAAIEYVDRIVDSFLASLLEETDRETTVIITSDHGENLGFSEDEGLLGHTNSLSESLLHVPLELINPPEGYDSVESQYFSHRQLGDLIVALARHETPDLFCRSPVAERITTSAVPETVSDEEFWKRTLRCYYDEETKLVWDSRGITQEYSLDHEVPCSQDLVDERKSIPSQDSTYFDSDIGTTHEQLVTESSSIEVDDSTRDRLEELGYL